MANQIKLLAPAFSTGSKHRSATSQNGRKLHYLCPAESLSKLCVGGGSSCREESPSGTLHSLDQLHETAGTLHTGYYLHTHTQTMMKN